METVQNEGARSVKRDEVLLKMEDFAASIDEFLKFRRYKILAGRGRVSTLEAKEKAHAEYVVFNKTQKINSDFEKQIARSHRQATAGGSGRSKIEGGVETDG